jgi:3-deoxy-manno-octulosonate cytidylyltransferase (CMP-KDO synthetase)
MRKSIVLIPARFGSSRFPGKPLAEILGIPMIVRVAQNFLANGLEVAVVTDDSRVEECLNEHNLKVLRVDDDVISGSERIALALERYYGNQSFEFVVNVQGDEPLLRLESVLDLINFHEKNPHFEITTFYKNRNELKLKNDPNSVKIVMSENNLCHYFSRSPIPFGEEVWKQHVGVYCYKVKALKDFVLLAPSKLEVVERLEQLRALENMMKIGAIEIKEELIGVDTPEDISRVEKILRNRKN